MKGDATVLELDAGNPASAPAEPSLAGDERLARALAWALAGLLAVFLAWPLGEILVKALQDRDGQYVGLANLRAVLGEPRVLEAARNSLVLATVVTALVVPLALGLAHALTQSRLRGRSVLKVIALSPLLTPSLMPAISLVYLFGHQGLIKAWLGGHSIYGPLGIVLGEAFYTFPYAVLVLQAALAMTDGRLYEAAEVLGASRFRRYLTVTVPAVRYGLVSACILVFTLVITDFGVPVVVGGSTNVLALEAYKQVLGQQNFQKGAAVGLMLLVPAALGCVAERWLARGRSGAIGGGSVAYRPKADPVRDGALWVLCAVVSVFLLAMVGTAMAASFIKLWPYHMNLTLAHYDFADMDGGGWAAFRHSLVLGGLTAGVGCGVVFTGAYLVEKAPVARTAAAAIRSLALVPMAVPGLVLGLGYVFCFDRPGNPLHRLYGTMAILVISTVVHFYTTAHLALATSLRRIDGEVEAVARSLRRPWWTTCRRVTLPVTLPALLDVARFLFVSAMTTVSCVIFLYTPDTALASVAMLNMDDAGDTAPAAALATLIVASSLAVTLVSHLVGWLLSRRTQAWRRAPV
jgi:iron(III) transport system permease protein